MSIFDYWYDFRAMAYSDELLIGLGALLLIFGILKIVKSSLSMLFWVILSGIGLTSIAQGLDQNPLQLAANQTGQVSEYLNAGKEISADALEVLCRKLDESGFGVPQQSEN